MKKVYLYNFFFGLVLGIIMLFIIPIVEGYLDIEVLGMVVGYPVYIIAETITGFFSWSDSIFVWISYGVSYLLISSLFFVITTKIPSSKGTGKEL